MKLLLDTQVLLWWLGSAPSLTDRARELIRNQENTVFVSAVTMWEIWLKVSLGKLRLPSDFEERLAGELFEGLPFTADHARAVLPLPWHYRDPFDRMLIAQAKAEGLKFLIADKAAAVYGDVVLLAS